MTDMSAVTKVEDKEKLTFRDVLDGVLHLPCGYLDDKGALHQRVELGEMTGEEEDILVSRGVPYAKVNRILASMLRSVGTITDPKLLQTVPPKLTICDRIACMLALRMYALGTIYDFNSICPRADCEHKNTHRLDLAELEVKPMKDPLKRQMVIDLPSGKKAVVHVMTGEDEERIANLKKGTVVAKAIKKKAKEDVLSLNLLARLTSVGDQVPDLRLVKKMSLRDRNAIRQWYDAHEGSIDTDLELTCTECDNEYASLLDVGQPSFFFPKESETTTP